MSRSDGRRTGSGKDVQAARRAANDCATVALVLQGGGALGACQAGVYQALHDAGIRPNWMAGISIGAIDAALIAGNPPERRVERLQAFWDRVSSSAVLPLPRTLMEYTSRFWPGDHGRECRGHDRRHSCAALIVGGLDLVRGAPWEVDRGAVAGEPPRPWARSYRRRHGATMRSVLKPRQRAPGYQGSEPHEQSPADQALQIGPLERDVYRVAPFIRQLDHESAVRPAMAVPHAWPCGHEP
jgi:hypothetical protein